MVKRDILRKLLDQTKQKISPKPLYGFIRDGGIPVDKASKDYYVTEDYDNALELLKRAYKIEGRLPEDIMVADVSGYLGAIKLSKIQVVNLDDLE